VRGHSIPAFLEHEFTCTGRAALAPSQVPHCPFPMRRYPTLSDLEWTSARASPCARCGVAALSETSRRACRNMGHSPAILLSIDCISAHPRLDYSLLLLESP
jgi:hypothetical protein